MKLHRIFRLLAEKHGLQYLLSNQSVHFIKDLQPSTSCDMIYLWQSMLRDEIVQQFINSEGSDGCIHQLSYKYSAQTGFEYGNIHSLLTTLSLGITQAFWGIEPADDTHTLSMRFQRNKSAWEKRQLIFNNGVLRILSNGKYGFIASDGTILIEPQYKSAGLFNEGLACVLDFGNNTYFINILGNKEFEFELPEKSSNQSGEIGPMKYGISIYSINKKYGLINRDGKTTPPIYDSLIWDGYSIVARKDNSWGLINSSDFAEIKAFEYSHMYLFNEDALFTEATMQSGQHIFLTREGRQVDFLEYDTIAHHWFIGSLILLVTKRGELIVVNNRLESHNFGFGCIINNKMNGKTYRLTKDIQNSPILYFRNGHRNSNELIHYTNRTDYIFIKPDGQVLNNTSFTMAHQFNNGIAWVKKGDKWHRINIDGDYLYTLRGFDVLTPEYRQTVLARNLRNGLLVLLSHNGEVIYSFPASHDSEIELDGYSHFIISTKNNDYIWYKGILTEINGKIILGPVGGTINGIIIRSNYILTRVDECKLGIYDLEDGQFYVFTLRDKNDKISHNPLIKLSRGLLCCKTPENRKYLVNTYSNKFSDLFDDFHRGHSYAIGERDGKDYLLDNDLNVICSFEQITPVIQQNATNYYGNL